MKRILIICILCCTLFTVCAQYTAMTFNIRYDNSHDGDNQWKFRKDEIIDMIQYYHPDILGIQEGLNNQVQFLNKHLTSYNYIGIGREDGNQKGEYAAIFYNGEKLEKLHFETFWLSETPHQVSVGWDASMERIVTYGVFKSKTTGDTLHVFNAHYDHMGKIAREKSSELILSILRQKKIEKSTLVIMGDFNSNPNSSPIQLLCAVVDDTYTTSEMKAYGPTGTFSDFKVLPKLNHRLDYIFTKNVRVKSCRIIDDRRKNNLFLSDHLPVFVEIGL